MNPGSPLCPMYKVPLFLRALYHTIHYSFTLYFTRPNLQTNASSINQSCHTYSAIFIAVIASFRATTLRLDFLDSAQVVGIWLGCQLLKTALNSLDTPPRRTNAGGVKGRSPMLWAVFEYSCANWRAIWNSTRLV